MKITLRYDTASSSKHSVISLPGYQTSKALKALMALRQSDFLARKTGFQRSTSVHPRLLLLPVQCLRRNSLSRSRRHFNLPGLMLCQTNTPSTRRRGSYLSCSSILNPSHSHTLQPQCPSLQVLLQKCLRHMSRRRTNSHLWNSVLPNHQMV